MAAVFNAMGYGRGLPDSAIAKVELTPEGRFRIYSGVSDMGQGNATAFVQIAGEILCQDASRLELVPAGYGTEPPVRFGLGQPHHLHLRQRPHPGLPGNEREAPAPGRPGA